MNILLGYILSVVIGITMGLVGGGGSILAVPLLAYLFYLDASIATFYSLFIVGGTSLVGSIAYLRKGLVDVKMAIFFGLPSVLAVFLSRHFIFPIIPREIIYTDFFTLTRDTFLLCLFAILMIVASYSMIKPSRQGASNQQVSINYVALIIRGFLVGLVTGLIGAGGGFLIIPALILFSKLPVKKAIGTSLVIIAINSLLGFSIGMLNSPSIEWTLILTILGLAIVGIFVGTWIAQRVDGNRLKPAFGWFILVMGIWIVIKELLIR